MALTLQRKLELAGDLAKVQPLLRRLHVLEKPKNHRVRNFILVSGAIGAGTLAVILVRRRRGGLRDGAVAGNGGYPADHQPPTQEAPATDSGV